jgi:hypothetical protein
MRIVKSNPLLFFFLAVFSSSAYLYTPVVGRKQLLHLIYPDFTSEEQKKNVDCEKQSAFIFTKL